MASVILLWSTYKIDKVVKLLKKIASTDSGIILKIIIIYFYNYYYYYFYFCTEDPIPSRTNEESSLVHQKEEALRETGKLTLSPT